MMLLQMKKKAGRRMGETGSEEVSELATALVLEQRTGGLLPLGNNT